MDKTQVHLSQYIRHDIKTFYHIFGDCERRECAVKKKKKNYIGLLCDISTHFECQQKTHLLDFAEIIYAVAITLMPPHPKKI